MAMVLAHRGANRVARENTIEAFAAAGRLGAHGVELDVRATADGVLVVHHDPDVEGRPLAGLLSGALPSWLPSLDEALDACAAMEVVNVEIKADGVTDPVGLGAVVARALTARPADGPPVRVSSFSMDVLDAHRAAAPMVATGWLSVLPMAAEDAATYVAVRGHAALHPHESRVTAELVIAARRHGLGVAAWTVNEPARAVELVAMGVDMVITDVPDLILTALAQFPRERRR